jgi:hypothetical protein
MVFAASLAAIECILALVLGRALAQARRAGSSVETEILYARVSPASIGARAGSGVLPPLSEESLILRDLVDLASAEGLSPVSFTPGELLSAEGDVVSHKQVELIVEGDFDKLGEFVGALRSLRAAPVTIESFQLCPASDGPPLLRGIFHITVAFGAS